MDSTSTPGDFVSEELQELATAASLNTATTRVQATEVQSQPVQHGGDEEDVQARDSFHHGLASDSDEAESGGENANLKEDEHPHTDDFKDNASIDSYALMDHTAEQQIDFKRGSSESIAKHKYYGTKYARVAALYTEGLETRVRTVEKELLELQYELGSKERPNEGSSGHTSALNSPFNSPCANPLRLKVMQVSLKDWKDSLHLKNWDKAWDKAAIFLATTTGTFSFQRESVNPRTHSGETELQLGGPDVNHDDNVHAADVRRLGPSDTARLAFNSPWPLILIELLSGEHISEGYAWIHPFKHIIVYEKQIRKCVELLNKTKVDGVEVKHLSRSLAGILNEVVRTLGPKRDEVEYSHTYVSSVLQKRQALKNHHSKVKSSSPKDQEEELEDDTEARPEVRSISPVDDPITRVSEPSNTAQEESSAPADTHYVCTCLKDARDHLQLLVNTIDSRLGSLLTLHNAIRDRAISKISFEHLWYLFQPGDVVVTSREPHQAYRVIHVSGGRPLLTTVDITRNDKGAGARPALGRHSQVSPFNIDCMKLDYDGEKFGPVQDTISILEYEEDRMITQLEVYPIGYAEKEQELSKTLLDRGRRFAGYHNFQHKRYEGLSLSEPQEEIESEVIIDFTQSYRDPEYAKHKPQIGPQGATKADEREVYEDICPAEVKNPCLHIDHNRLVNDTLFDKLRMDRFLNVESHGMFLESRGVSHILTEDQLILLPYRVNGFSLRSRKWVPLNVDLLQEVKENDSLDGQNSGFDDLVIPDEYKKIVKALVKSHSLGSRPESRDKQQIDLIRGKGKGLIILLHGVPGVGKTSTAESVASYTGRPLFPITCGDIGQTAYDVEENLEDTFLLARRWGCVLLLDEADIFLAKRERGGDSIDRNALVSVFLRTLEYYSGILFLTTNRIGSFDEAFKSRIHISLYYPPLSENQTFEVWAMNLNRLSKSHRDIFFDKSEIEAFARRHWKDGKRWNGRQIRNAFQTAVALAEYDFQDECQKCEQTGERLPFRPRLKDQHFKAVARTSAEFDDYLQSVMHGQTHEQKAYALEMRNDAYDPERGIDTPSGKRYSSQRAVRPSRSSEQPPVLRESEAFREQTATPPVTLQLSGTGLAGSSVAPDDEEEEYRQWKAEEERKKQAEKMERFRKMHERELMGK